MDQEKGVDQENADQENADQENADQEKGVDRENGMAGEAKGKLANIDIETVDIETVDDPHRKTDIQTIHHAAIDAGQQARTLQREPKSAERIGIGVALATRDGLEIGAVEKETEMPETERDGGGTLQHETLATRGECTWPCLLESHKLYATVTCRNGSSRFKFWYFIDQPLHSLTCLWQ
jgi:hypothetical protein